MAALETFFAPEEISLIKGIDEEFPDRQILDRFNYFISSPGERRRRLARALLERMPRQGLVKIGAPAPAVRSIFNHETNGAHLVKKLAAADRLPPGVDARESALDVNDHDTIEAGASDFTHRDRIYFLPEKTQIERLSARMIFERHPEKLKRWLRFEDKDPSDTGALFDNDIDQLEMLCNKLWVQRTHPPKDVSVLNEFWESAWKRLHTDEAKEFYVELRDIREGRRAAETSPVFMAMSARYDGTVKPVDPTAPLVFTR